MSTSTNRINSRPGSYSRIPRGISGFWQSGRCSGSNAMESQKRRPGIIARKGLKIAFKSNTSSEKSARSKASYGVGSIVRGRFRAKAIPSGGLNNFRPSFSGKARNGPQSLSIARHRKNVLHRSLWKLRKRPKSRRSIWLSIWKAAGRWHIRHLAKRSQVGVTNESPRR